MRRIIAKQQIVSLIFAEKQIQLQNMQ